MNRRRFLTLLGLAPVVAKFAPLLPEVTPAPIAYSTYVMGREAMLAQYCDYANFSDFAVVAYLEPEVLTIAERLGEAHARRIDKLIEGVQFEDSILA